MLERQQVTIAGWDIGRARPGDGQQIADLFRTIPAPEVLLQTVWSSPRADVYVEDLIAGRYHGVEMDFYVIRRGNRVAGAIGARYMDNRLFFDNCVADAEVRAGQMALPFMTTTIRLTSSGGSYEETAFDVYLTNRALLTLYRRVGAITQEIRYWHQGRIRIEETPRAGSVCEDPGAIENHRRYGFSVFHVETSQSRYAVGKLANHGYRLPSDSAWNDSELLAALRLHDAGRTVYVPSRSSEPPEGCRFLVGFSRMHVKTARFLSGLESYIAKRRRGA